MLLGMSGDCSFLYLGGEFLGEMIPFFFLVLRNFANTTKENRTVSS